MASQQTDSSVSASQPILLLIHGPNLNLLGTREPEKYGKMTLADLEAKVESRTTTHNMSLKCFQSNHEGAILDFVHGFSGNTAVKGIIINAGAFTHTSVAIRDGLLSVNVPFIEVHITNVHAREPFRHHSYLSDKATAVICGLGIQGYFAAVDYFAEKVNGSQST